jgi:hypothetical protein
MHVAHPANLNIHYLITTTVLGQMSQGWPSINRQLIIQHLWTLAIYDYDNDDGGGGAGASDDDVGLMKRHEISGSHDGKYEDGRLLGCCYQHFRGACCLYHQGNK